MENNPAKRDTEQVQAILANFASTVHSLGAEIPETDEYRERNNELRIRKLILSAALYNAEGREPPFFNETQTAIQNTENLHVVAELLRTKPLVLRMPRILTVSVGNKEEYEVHEGFPIRRMVLGLGRLAGRKKMKEACIYGGIPIQKVFDRRLPSALICIETTRHRSRPDSQGNVRQESNLNLVRMPSCIEPYEEAQRLFMQNKELPEDLLVNAHLVGSLAYYLAIQTRRKAVEYLESYGGAATRHPSSIRKTYESRGIYGLIDKYSSDLLHEYNEENWHDTRQESRPSILHMAAQEYADKMGIDWGINSLAVHTKYTAMAMLLEYDPEASSYRLREIEEIERFIKLQALDDLTLRDLAYLADQFIQDGEREFLTEEQKNDADSKKVAISDIIQYVGQNIPLSKAEVRVYEQDLRDYLLDLVQVRFETIQDQWYETEDEWVEDHSLGT